MKEYTCKHCGKLYTANTDLGTWQLDNTQKKSCIGVSVKNFCCYECGKEYRAKQIKETWKNKSTAEITTLVKKRKNRIKPVTCIVCGKKFIPNRLGGKNNICSDECREKRFLKVPKTGIYTCEECGKEINYIENQGNWNKENILVNPRGINKEFTVKSHKFCCYECGTKQKERKRRETNISKYGYISPWENIIMRAQMFEKMKTTGTLFISQPEKELREWIESLGLKTDRYIIGNGLYEKSQRFEIDILIPELNIGVEFNGAYYHCMNGKKKGRITKNYHFEKSKMAKDNNVELIHIWEDQWHTQKDLLKTILLARFNKLNPATRIYARKCKIKEINTETYKAFCEKYHIQGYRQASVKLGLFYNNTLVQIASFGKTNNRGKANIQNKKYEWEWIRGCPASNNFVVGGTSKLFKHFIKMYNPSTVLCYADWNLFNGRGYKECDFKFDGFTGPDKFYIQPKPLKRINRNPYKYKEFMDKVKQDKLWLCYGAGSQRFIWKKLEE